MKRNFKIPRILVVLIFLSSVQTIFARAIPQILFIRANKDTVAVYEKWELSMDVKAEYVNPFNPEDISITAHFISPSGIPWKINGFYNYNSWQSCLLYTSRCV